MLAVLFIFISFYLSVVSDSAIVGMCKLSQSMLPFWLYNTRYKLHMICTLTTIALLFIMYSLVRFATDMLFL